MANEDFYTEAMEAIRACDRVKATDVATRALAAGVAPDDLLKTGLHPRHREDGRPLRAR